VEIITTLIIAVSLSMDSFSLSLIYGTLNLTKKKIKWLSFIVGCFHFVMPLLGLVIGNFIINILNIHPHIVISIVFLFIGVEMIISSFKNEGNIILLDLKGLFLFGFTVSIDSFTVGAGMKAFTNNYILSSFIFCLVSAIFTYMGLILGKKINEKIGKISTRIGGVFLLILSISYLIFI